MKLKLDENIPVSAQKVLSAMGHDVDTARDEHLEGSTDSVIWDSAHHAGRLLVTQDMDFSDVRQFMPGSHEGLLLIRLQNPGRNAIVSKLESVFRSEHTEEWGGCFVVVTDLKVRVIRPK